MSKTVPALGLLLMLAASAFADGIIGAYLASSDSINSVDFGSVNTVFIASANLTADGHMATPAQTVNAIQNHGAKAILSVGGSLSAVCGDSTLMSVFVADISSTIATFGLDGI
ncbi:hypothetical protein HDU98_002725, partial [Podochytrium sp. JEL0797]